MKNFVNSIFKNIKPNITNKNSQATKDSQIFQNYNFIGNYKPNPIKINAINLGITKNHQKQYDDFDIDNIKIINIGTSDFKNKVQNKLEKILKYEEVSITTIINKETDESYCNEINSILDTLNENKKDNIFSSNEGEIKKIDHKETEISHNEIESIIDNFNQPKINKVKVESFKNWTNINQKAIRPLTIYESIIKRQDSENSNKNPAKNTQKLDRPQNAKYFLKKIKQPQPTLYEAILEKSRYSLLNNKITKRPNNHPSKKRQDISLYSKININKPIEKQETASKENEWENKYNMIPYLNKYTSPKGVVFNKIEPIRFSKIKILPASQNYCESGFFKKLLEKQKNNINIR